MLRIIFIFMLVFATSAFAADATTPTAPSNPIDALKNSLQKEAPKAPVAKTQNIAITDWATLPPESRAAILKDWENQPESTRQPFPVFRDSAIAKLSGKAVQTSNDADGPPNGEQEDDVGDE